MKIGDKYKCIESYYYNRNKICDVGNIVTIHKMFYSHLFETDMIHVNEFNIFLWAYELNKYFSPIPFKYGK